MRTHDELMTDLMRTIAAEIRDGDILVPHEAEDITVERLRDGELAGCGLYRWLMTEIDEGSEEAYTEGDESAFLTEAERLITAALEDLKVMLYTVVSLHDDVRGCFDPVTLPNGMVVDGYAYRLLDDYPTKEDQENAGIYQEPPEDAWEWQIALRKPDGEQVDRYDSLETLLATSYDWQIRDVAENALAYTLGACREGRAFDFFDLL